MSDDAVLEPEDLAAAAEELEARIVWVRDYLDPDALRARVAALDERIGTPGFWDDPRGAGKVSAERAKVGRELDMYDRLAVEVADLPGMLEMAAEEPDLEPEVADTVRRLRGEIDALQEAALFKGEYDAGPAVVQVTAGAGGTDAQDWAEMLLRMYLRWAEKRGFKAALIEATAGEEAGLKSATFTLTGDNAYGVIAAEKGVHRLVRLSPFDKDHRRHTAFASLAAAPWLDDDVDVEIDEKELRVDTYRSQGAGGQHVNKTDSAVRLTHLPTGLVVQCQNERSQQQNRAVAMRVLKSRLLELEIKKRDEEIARARGEAQDISFGSQIRSYVLHPYTMVNDHRTGRKDGNATAVLDGEVDPFIRDFLLGRATADADRN
jgi:peptide chain release factor 2